MEELLAKSGYTPGGLSRGQRVEGKVIEIATKSLVLDIGLKSEGLVVDHEFEAAKPFIRKLAPGDIVPATVVVPETESGQVLLSVKDAADDYAWAELEEKLKTKEEVDAYVEMANKGGLAVLSYGIPGFIPSSHLGSALLINPAAAQGKTLKVKVIEVDREKGRLVLSEKAVSESELLDQQRETIEKIKEGERFKGRVTKVTNFGAFVKIEKDQINIEGLVHLSEISWQKVPNPQSVLKEDDEVEVAVIGKENTGSDKLALSIKRTTEDPWDKALEKYPVDSKVQGTVTKVGDFGAFVEVEPGIEGLIHAGKFSGGELSLKEGEEVEIFVEEIDPKNHRLSLGLALKTAPVGYK
ncbi:MAG: S1 RNA-binding domain-containing protein [Candidatus Blackburnbacteria bacterium]|nr:S1 RNA-binding domain-containing protein [Candidatus Blackburnbacteria bacterium]